MRFVDLLACTALVVPGLVVPGLASAAEAPGYTARVQHSYVPSGAVQRLAMLPIACPDTLDCGKFTARVTKSLAKATKLSATSASRTSEVMANARIDKLDYETGYILAEALDVHAFAAVVIEQASIDILGQKQILLDGKQIHVDGPQVKHVRINLRIVGKDGAELLASSGEGQLQSIFTSLDDVAVQTFELLLEQAVAKN